MTAFWSIIGAGAPVSMAGAALVTLRRNGWSLSEAAAGGTAVALVVLSLLTRAALSVGEPRILGPAAVVLMGGGGVFLVWKRRQVEGQWRLALAFGRSQPLATAIILAVLAAVAAGVGGAPGKLPAPSYAGVSVPDNGTALLYFWADFGISPAAGGIAGLVVVAAATYALARRYAWPPIAATVTLVTLSQPRLVRLALLGSPELMSAAAGLFALMTLYRTVERPRFENLAALVLGLSFIPCRLPLGRAFTGVLVVLSVVVLYRRHGMHLWWAMIRRRRWLAVVVAAGCLAVGGTWQVVLPDPGNAPPGYAFNPDAIIGATANLLRYLWESLNPGPSFQGLGKMVMGISPRQWWSALYSTVVEPVFGQRGAAFAFRLASGAELAGVWFGPLALCLVLPAVGYALVRGPRRLKAVAAALVGYGYLAALIPAWAPGNAALFTRFFVCGGFVTAFLLPPWRLTRAGTLALQCLCFLLMAVTFLHAAGWSGQ
ncbi:MAG TPA: hypothetical protein ENF48_08685 [Desulfobacteraceae bacterium]|nr:hypothetical protein [Deltaproteobacteria bacterium]RLB98296.1 MAG: hypothetical protein DRH76_02905 [Deltaproteobacteria bacterium]HDI60409.1 hypothetical protein [Desulfobacteraceae bacterium]